METTMDIESNGTAYDDNNTQSMGFDYDFEAVNGCGKGAFDALNHASGVVPAIGIILTICTMMIISCDHRLRTKRNIFPFNIVLSDFVLDFVLFADYVKWEFGVLSNNEIWTYAIGVPYRATHMVSTGSIFLVAIDQFVAFKIDSFGSKNILTKGRCICLCIAIWVIMLLVSTCINVWATDPRSVRFVLSNLALVLTGVCYLLVYKTISKSQLNGGLQLQERRKENNKRVLTTYILILGTTLLLFTLPDLIFFLLYDVQNKFFSSCVFFGWYILQTLNTITNCVIYWWRLKDFRAIIAQKLSDMKGAGKTNTSVPLNTLSGKRVNIRSKQSSSNSQQRSSKLDGQFDSPCQQVDCSSAQKNNLRGQTDDGSGGIGHPDDQTNSSSRQMESPSGQTAIPSRKTSNDEMENSAGQMSSPSGLTGSVSGHLSNPDDEFYTLSGKVDKLSGKSLPEIVTSQSEPTGSLPGPLGNSDDGIQIPSGQMDSLSEAEK